MPFSSPIPGQPGSQQPLSIPSSSSSSPNHHYPHASGSFPRQTSYSGTNYPQGSRGGGGGEQSRWDNGSGSTSGSASGGGMVSNLSALMRSRGDDMNGMDIGSSPPGGYANSSLSSNPHSGFHPSSYGPNLPFSAIALGMSHHQHPYMGNSIDNMGMSISPPHWGSLGSGSFVGSMGHQFGTSMNSRNRELEARYVRDFSCCGRKLNGLHELLEHYEEEHANLAPDLKTAAINAANNSMNPHLPPIGPPIPNRNPYGGGAPGPGQIPPTPTSLIHQSDVPAPPGMMDIEMDEPSPQYPSTPNYHPPHPNQRNLPHHTGGMPSNPWAAAFRPQLNNQQNQGGPLQCVPPSLLSYAPPTPGSASSQNGQQQQMMGGMGGNGMGAVLTPEQLQAKAIRKAQKKAERAAREEVSADDPEGERRFPCPIEGCGKVYKQANGLKYHLTRSINSGHGNVAALGGLAAILGEDHGINGPQ
ncbi:uncharacterized protein L201_004926 [Kwoniella dendrophila CBS 6074]|uniref:C2H2-type domain-containing protein n=1 Tax=Kwoniella dendrophila CBS 6074 TaxID=1295534 RepID=A0AAX4JX26_9TREE